jgi:hypothetical protein
MSKTSPNYTIEMKTTGVTPGTFGALDQLPLLTITNKGLITSLSTIKLTNDKGVVDKPVFTLNFTISGLNTTTNPCYSSLEYYDPDETETINGSGFIGNYGNILYDPYALKYYAASGSYSIGAKSNSVNPNNIDNLAIGQQSMASATCDTSISIGSNTLYNCAATKVIHIGHNSDLINILGNNSIVIGSQTKLDNGKNNITIGTNNSPFNTSDSNNFINIGGLNNASAVGNCIMVSNNSDFSSNQKSFSYKLNESNIILSIADPSLKTAYSISSKFNNCEVISPNKSWPFGTDTAGTTGTITYNFDRSVFVGGGIGLSYILSNHATSDCVAIGNSITLNLEVNNTDDIIKNAVAIGSKAVAASNSVSIGTKAGRFDINDADTPLTGVALTSGDNMFDVFGTGLSYRQGKATEVDWRGASASIPTSSIIDRPIAIARGIYSTMILNSDGRLFASGNNSVGELGLTLIRNPGFFNLVDWSTNNRCKYLAGTAVFNVVIKEDGSLWGAGWFGSQEYNEFTMLDPGVWTQVSVGNYYDTSVPSGSGSGGNFRSQFLAGIKSDGRIYTAGCNDNGQCGQGFVSATAPIGPVAGDWTYTKVRCGGRHAVAIRSDGRLVVWGSNDKNQFGITVPGGASPSSSVPLLVSHYDLSGVTSNFLRYPQEPYDTSDVIDCDASYESTCAVTANNNVYIAGRTVGANRWNGINQRFRQWPQTGFNEYTSPIGNTITHTIGTITGVTSGKQWKAAIGFKITFELTGITGSPQKYSVFINPFNRTPAGFLVGEVLIFSDFKNLDSSPQQNYIGDINGKYVLTEITDAGPPTYEVRYKIVAANFPNGDYPNFNLSGQAQLATPIGCNFANSQNLMFKLSDGGCARYGGGYNGVFFDGINGDIIQGSIILRYINELAGKNVILHNGIGDYTGNAAIIDGRNPNHTSARICIASAGKQYPYSLSIGDATTKIGAPNGSGVETTASAGSASDLPATPEAYLRLYINQTKYKMPLYNL